MHIGLDQEERQRIQTVLDVLNPRRVDKVQSRGGKPVYEFEVKTGREADRRLVGTPRDSASWGQFELPDAWAVQREDYRRVLASVAASGRVPEDDRVELTNRVENLVGVTPKVEWRNGRPTLRTMWEFQNADGILAFTLLRLSQLWTPDYSPLVCCEECDTFTLTEPRPGRPVTKYCSARCRNRANARRIRADQDNPPVRRRRGTKSAMHK